MDLQTQIDDFLALRRRFVDSFTRDFRRGTPAAEIVRVVGDAFFDDSAAKYLAGVEVHDAAAEALREAGLDSIVDLTMPEIDGPHEPRLHLAAGADVTNDYATAPTRIRAALRDRRITLALTQEEPAAESGQTVDEQLHAGAPVLLIKM